MTQDRSNSAKSHSSNKMARIRATRLSADPDSIIIQPSEPDLPVAQQPPAASVPTAGMPDSDEIEKLQTLQLAAAVETMRTILAEKTPLLWPDDLNEVEKLQTFQLPSIAQKHPALSAETGALTEEISQSTEVENQQTVQLPARMQSSQPASPTEVSVNDKPLQADSLENQQTLQLPVVEKSRQELPAQDRLPADLSEVEAQQTQLLPFVPGRAAVAAAATSADILSPKGLIPGIRKLVSVGLARLQEPQPEGPFTRGLQVIKPGISLGMFPLLILTNALGLLLVSISYYLGQLSSFALEFSFLLGLLLLFVPNALRLLSSAPPRIERIYLLCGLGLSFYLVAFMASPQQISSFDEFLHWVTADNILRTDHLFSANSMLPVSPYYPGLEIITNAISSLTGLNTFYASIPLIVVSRLLLVLALFLFYEQITGSSRMAGIAALIYMVNPHFIFFDSMYSYETLALPLAIGVFYILARYERVGGEHRWIIFTSWMVLMAITFTHHMTDYVTDGLLLLWAIVSFFSAATRKTRIHLLSIAIFGVTLAIMYALLVNGNPVWSYLSSYFNTAFAELGRILTGTGSSRPLFSSSGGPPSPIWDRLLMMGSVAIIAFCLPFGLLTLWRLHRRNALSLTLGIFALTYPVAQAFRFTPFGTEIADRSAAFLFLAVAYVMTLLITHFWPTRKLSKRAIALITCAMSVVLLGGAILDAGAGYTGLPGPYVVGADARSVEPEGIDAALWTLAYLGPDNRIGTDRTNQMLMSTYGDQHVVTELGDLVEVSPLFYSLQFDQADIALLRAGKVQYLVVDLRLSTALPALGFYFVSDEPQANHLTAPISRSALTKFDAVPQMNRFFDSGNIVIYGTGAFLGGPGS